VSKPAIWYKKTMYWLYYGAPLAAGLAAAVYSIVKPFLLSRKQVEDQGFLHYSGQVKRHTLNFVRREYRIISTVIGITGLLLIFQKNGHSRLVVLSFLLGAFVTAGAGLCGTIAATYSNRLTVLAARRSTMKALRSALNGGSVLGFAIVGFSLTAITLLLVLLTALFGTDPEALRSIVLPNLFGYALGAGLVALLGRSAGGIFAKVADISADLTGKNEMGFEEDDPRNPSCLADTVGDNVNDITGLGLDLSESYAAALLSCMLIGAASGKTAFIYLPLVLAASGIVISFLAIIFIRTPEYGRPETTVMRWLITTHVVLAAAGAALSMCMLGPAEAYGISGAYAAGILCGILVSLLAGYYTASARRPVISIASSSRGGVTPSIIQGLATGMGSTVLPVLALIGTLLAAYRLSGFYGVTIAAFGLMSGAAVHAGVDAAGTIIDNAGAFAMLAMFPPASRERTDKLDEMGNAFNAVGKGYTVCSAAFISIALFVVFKKIAHIDVIDLTEIDVLAGILIGAAFPFFFASYLLHGVNSVLLNTLDIVRQLLRGESSADLTSRREQVIDACRSRMKVHMYWTAGAAIGLPVGIWLIGDPAMLGGVMLGILITGTLLALWANHSGGGWDNAKKYVESGAFGGKGSDAHHAAVISDTVGDSLKDVVGPAMDIVMKLFPVVAIILVGV